MIRTEDYKREFYSILFAQKWAILLIALVISVGAVLIALYWPPTYSANGSILVKGKHLTKSPESLEGQPEIRYIPLAKEDMASEVEILLSPDVVERTITALRADNRYRALSKKPQFSLADEVFEVRRRLRTEILPASNVIAITFFSREPQEAVTLLDTLMKQYVAFRMQFFYPSEAELFFAQQADKYRDELTGKDNEMAGLFEQTKVSDPQKEIENNLLVKKDLEEQLNILRTDHIRIRQSVEHLDKAVRDSDVKYFSFVESVPMNQLSIRLMDLHVERGQLTRKFLPDSGPVKAIDDSIRETYAVLKNEAASYRDNLARQLAIATEQIADLDRRIATLDLRNVNLKKQQFEAERMANDATLLQDSYATFYKRREEAKIQSAEDTAALSTYVSVLARAFPSDGPVFPRKNVVIPLGILTGLITGISIGFLREYFDHTFKKPSEVTLFTGLPVIFSIPRRWPGGSLR